MLDTQVRNVEWLHVHVVGTELVPERAMSLGAWQRQVVQLQFVALVPAGHTDTSQIISFTSGTSCVGSWVDPRCDGTDNIPAPK